MAIFSVWDSESNCDPPEELRAHVTYSGEGVEVSRCGNQGTGGKTMMPLEWKLGEPVHFKMNAADIDGDIRKGSSNWFQMATIKTIAHFKLLDNVYSFVQDFRSDGTNHSGVRSAQFGNYYTFEDGCQNKNMKARFTADDITPTMNINAGLCDDKFYLTTGGDTENPA